MYAQHPYVHNTPSRASSRALSGCCDLSGAWDTGGLLGVLGVVVDQASGTLEALDLGFRMS